MSTSLLYHGFGVRGYRHVRTRFEGGAVVFVIDRPREDCRCSHCGSDDVHSRGTVCRRFRCSPLGRKPIFLSSCRRGGALFAGAGGSAAWIS